MTGTRSGSFVRAAVAMTTILVPAVLRAATPELPFYENFEPLHGGGSGHWDYTAQWQACDVLGHPSCPEDPFLPADSKSYGPLKFETWPDKDNGGHVFSGQRSGRQPIWDPYWGAILHEFVPPAGNRELRLKVWVRDEAGILCDCDQQAQPFGYVCDCDNLPTPRPSRPNFDVHGWVILNAPDRSEYFILAVNSKKSWTRWVWATPTDGWVVTDVPRARGWHKAEIVVRPYTGNVGDVEFRLDDVVIGEGRRAPGAGTGLDVSWLRLGGDPAVLAESHLTNTFEEFWYDEVALTACHNPRPDVDGDGDVDQTDYAVLQRCWTGPGDPLTFNEGFDGANCQCVDTDGDKDVDTDDFDVFQGCAAGPEVAPNPDCDG